MTGTNVVDLAKSPAFTILIATICILIIMNQVPVLITTMKAIKTPAIPDKKPV